MNTVPQHIAIIMDGNRRWAKERGLPAVAGHRKVANEILEPLIDHAADRGITFITFWAFSTENWQRSKSEVNGIMRIFRHLMKRQFQRLHEKGVRIRIIGDISRFAPDIRKGLEDGMEKTKRNKRITAVFALNYGGRDEILRAIKRLGTQEGTEENFSQNLDTAGIPDPELIIRPGGEQRLSGFLLWQSEYSELYFQSWYMPEFTREKLDEAIAEYKRRQRRFGK
ncbi:di-trans,poly-cis-decaprenylcistransferase [Candidatus Gottesmanbacteria bacterium]|nr:di-trans,poly-cis-decaprenylcistransferase [Candidatus Gottesmanbacteria bacterium]